MAVDRIDEHSLHGLARLLLALLRYRYLPDNQPRTNAMRESIDGLRLALDEELSAKNHISLLPIVEALFNDIDAADWQRLGCPMYEKPHQLPFTLNEILTPTCYPRADVLIDLEPVEC